MPTFDTLKAARALTAAGAKEPLAEAIVTTMNEAVAEGAATKADIAEVKAELAEVKAEVKGDIAGLKAEISAIKWVLGILAGMQLLMAGRMFGVF